MRSRKAVVSELRLIAHQKQFSVEREVNEDKIVFTETAFLYRLRQVAFTSANAAAPTARFPSEEQVKRRRGLLQKKD